MNAVEELRRLLDRRGIEWRKPALEPQATWFLGANGKDCSVQPWDNDLFLIRYYLTPDEAIAAALGDPEAVAFCKRVEKAVANHEPLTLFGVDYEPVGNEPFCETVERWLNGDAPKECRECTEGKYAELVAKLGRGECEMDVLDTGNEAAYEHYEYIMHCANCYHEFGYVQYSEDGDTWMNEKPRFCPNCGRHVKGGAE